MVSTGSVVVRRQLGRELRGLREASGRVREDVTIPDLGIASLAKLSRIERGQVSIRPGDVRELCALYGADALTTERLVELARGTKSEEWWESQDLRAPRWFGLYLSLEQVAERIQIYEPTLVHGLFQTPQYMRALASRTEVDVASDHETLLASRRTRQEKVLHRTPPLRIELILSEAALRVRCEGPHVMQTQIAHLRAMTLRHEISIAVIPLSEGLHPGAYGGFTILDFPDVHDPSTVYLETYESARYPERAEQVTRFRRRFQALRDVAVPIEEWEP